jgi:hypothetical protein
MQLSLAKALPCGVIFPHTEQGRPYYLLFHTKEAELPLYVKTSDLENPSLFHIGDVHSGGYEGPVVGSCFFTQANHVSRGGVFCLAYTGVFGRRAEAKATKALNLGVDLSLKTPHFMMWSKRGAATLIVTPQLAGTLKESLET